MAQEMDHLWPASAYVINPYDSPFYIRWKEALQKGVGKDYRRLQRLMNMKSDKFYCLAHDEKEALRFCCDMLGWDKEEKPYLFKSCCRAYPRECGGVCCEDSGRECQCGEYNFIDLNSPAIIFHDNCYDDCCVIFHIFDEKKTLTKIKK